MSSNEGPCPIWDDAADALRRVQEFRQRPYAFTQPELREDIAMPCCSPRADGSFKLNMSGAALLKAQPPTLRQSANLSYRIYHHNLCNQLFGKSPEEESPDPEKKPPVLDEGWIKENRDCIPSTSDRMLTFLREVIRRDEALLPPDKELLSAAGGCRHCNDLEELERHAFEQGWLRNRNPNKPWHPGCQYQINLSARIHVEDQLAKQDSGSEDA